ncbi:MAG: HPr family phosphocarrier protein [Oscillospiraceae bacterium]
MKIVKIKLDTVVEVQKFVSLIATMKSDFDLISGRYIVDAKSILGIFSLDIQKPLELKIHSCTDDIIEKLSDYIVE